MKLACVGALVCLVASVASQLTISPDTVTETDATETRTFTISGFTTTSQWVIQAKTLDGTAVGGTHFTGIGPSSAFFPPLDGNGDIQFLPDTTTQIDIDIDILGDNLYGGAASRSFIFSITSLSGVSDAPVDFTITIMEDEDPPVDLQYQVTAIPITEGSLAVDISFNRNGDGTTHLFLFDLECVGGGTATPDVDFVTFPSASISFPAMAETHTVTGVLNVVDDEEAEIPEDFTCVASGDAIVAPITATITIEDNDTPFPVKCNRDGQRCVDSQGTCNTDAVGYDGTCDCNAGFNGPLCEYETTTLDCATQAGFEECGQPPDHVGTTGQCVTFQPGGTVGCACSPGWAGDLCHIKAYTAYCAPNEYFICITPYNFADFVGEMYVYVDGTVNYRDVPACVLTPTMVDATRAELPLCGGYWLNQPYLMGDCGQPAALADVTDPVTMEAHHSISVRLAYTQGVFGNRDELVTFTCTVSAGGTGEVDGGTVEIIPDVDTSSGTPNGEVQNFSPAMQTSMYIGTTNIVSEAVTPGVRITTCVTVDGVDAYEAIEVEKITVDDNNGGADPHVLWDPVDCVQTEQSSYLISAPEYIPINNPKDQVCFTWETFQFPGSTTNLNRVVTRVVAVVATADATLPAYPCTVKRRKRSTNGTEIEDRKTGELSTLVELLVNRVVPVSQTANAPTAACDNNWLTPAMIGLGIVSITMAVIIVVLVFAVIKQYKRKDIP